MPSYLIPVWTRTEVSFGGLNLKKAAFISLHQHLSVWIFIQEVGWAASPRSPYSSYISSSGP